MGIWKMILNRGSGGFSTPRKITPRPRNPAGQLYDLSTDPSETHNVWDENPSEVARLKIALGDISDPLDRQRIRFTSSADGSEQEAILILPESAQSSEGPIPMVVSLHSWSANLNQRNELERLVHDRGCMEVVFVDNVLRNYFVFVCKLNHIRISIMHNLFWDLGHL